MPDAKRVLLTAYADTEAAISAINEVSLDYYLLKPWDPPEEELFPVLEDLLTVWQAEAEEQAGGLRVVGHRFSKESHDLRDFLARNRVPRTWHDYEIDPEARELLKVAGVDESRLPVVILEDGSVLERPTTLELAERLGVDEPAGAGSLRPRDRGRRPRGAGRGGLRRVGGPAHADGRARGARRPGGPVQPHRELPRVPDRAERLRPRAPGDRPGAQAGGRAAHGPGRRGPARGGRGPLRRAERRRGAQRQLRARGVGRDLPAARRARVRGPHRRRHLLRRGADRGADRAATSTWW